MRKVKEIKTKTYRKESVYIETEYRYYYNSEEERLKHLKLMASKGYKASSQMEENIGSLVTPNYVWVGIYYKCENKER
mgnify:CR=1 FL=1|jgi:hypothetical protein